MFQLIIWSEDGHAYKDMNYLFLQSLGDGGDGGKNKEDLWQMCECINSVAIEKN